MSQPPPHPHYSRAEEIASSLSHALGIVLGIAGLAVLAAFATLHGGTSRIVSVSIYGATLILLFTASTLYHAVPNPRAKPILRVLDHSAIFLLIAGTYTPFALISLRGPWGWSLFAIVWTLAIIGIALELRHVRNRMVAALLYLGMGWVGIVAIKPMLANIEPGGLWLLFAGGLCYTLGVPFYLWKRLPYNHALWHLFVLAGSVLQFFSVLLYVLPDN
ncbi:MAG: hemolysin III family protein [Dokdonella sp.]|uniref:PAQR family membrane homeostasis protein TrhA n=3 Tax=Dokdonella sp. TaxID=2291710 RepID=UPI002C3DF76F|nr:hemolysin III family protein [Xanthomonadales bacterium]HQV71578.1 hemolysin III family protein [Dokdonella sp.]MBK7209903.1 hemolysin III family protein [Xanthomonadales bacterium]MBL0222560.1 hemolysin III family protein [Xanthomonadales bacterium]HQW75905.1 hemolysin III family protein [Dokdonella sp.]